MSIQNKVIKKTGNDECGSFDKKTKEYKIAIEKYKNIAWYTRIETSASYIIVTLQLATLTKLFLSYNTTNFFTIILTFLFAYIATDFISGIVHMIADNSTNYTSPVGPFIAAFKLHHLKLFYQSNHPIKVYFYESGHKLWLVFYLFFLLIIQNVITLNFCFNLLLVSIGILSSVSEVSHFWCHNRRETNIVIRFLQKYNILLSMKHHRIHHANDNMHYAFLNGVTDPLLNIIAHIFYNGYKNYSDQHVIAADKNQH